MPSFVTVKFKKSYDTGDILHTGISPQIMSDNTERSASSDVLHQVKRAYSFFFSNSAKNAQKPHGNACYAGYFESNNLNFEQTRRSMSVNWVACGTCYRKTEGTELGGIELQRSSM